MKSTSQCEATTKKGARCRNRADGGKYCAGHARRLDGSSILSEKKETSQKPVSEQSLVKVDQPKWENYKAGTCIEEGHKISSILGKDEISCVWMDEKSGLWWDYNKTVALNARPYIAYAVRLHMQVKATIPEKRWAQVIPYLGSRLFSGLLKSTQGDDTFDPAYFSNVEELIETKSREASHSVYLFSGSVLVLVLGLLWIAVYFSSSVEFRTSGIFKIFFGSTAGSVGALLSIVSRFRSIEIQRYASSASIGTQSITKVLLGFLSGGFLVLAIQAGFISVSADNLYAIGVFCVVAGFSERLVPELMGKLENRVVEKNRDSETGGNPD